MKKIQMLIDELEQKSKQEKLQMKKEFHKLLPKLKQKLRSEEYRRFLLDKYEEIIKEVVMEMKDDHMVDDFIWEDNEFNIKNKRKLAVSMVYIEEIELFKLFRKKLEEENCFSIDPLMFRSAIGRLAGYRRRNNHRFECDFNDNHFFLDRIMVNNKELLRIIY